MRIISSREIPASVNHKSAESSGARTLTYFRNRHRPLDKWGNWWLDRASNVLQFRNEWSVDLSETRDGAAAFHALADFAKYAIDVTDVADLGRALRKVIPDTRVS
jgi:hypothetical protein